MSARMRAKHLEIMADEVCGLPIRWAPAVGDRTPTLPKPQIPGPPHSRDEPIGRLTGNLSHITLTLDCQSERAGQLFGPNGVGGVMLSVSSPSYGCLKGLDGPCRGNRVLVTNQMGGLG